MFKLVMVLLVALGVAVTGFSLIDSVGGGEVGATAALAAPIGDISGYAQAVEPLDWSFPRDYGAHRDYQTEWWYYTGNLTDETGRRFGYQFTIFRRAIAPEGAESDSEWRTNHVYMAHFTVSDIAAQAFHHEQRFSRGGAGLADALPHDDAPDAPYRVFIEDWVIAGDDSTPDRFTIRAESANNFAIDLTLDALKPPALQGTGGLSPKSGVVGNASHYYSHSRLETSGTITIDGETFTVGGLSWKDHEFSTSALGETALGWDWFGLHFDDGRDLMVGQIRLVEGGREPAFGGLLIQPDGSTRYLESGDFTITPTATWVSPHTGATYPAGWDISIPSEGLTFNVTPLQADQELYDSDPSYWEGAVSLSGGVTGFGYAELTGYTDAMTRRF
ncbi:MAG: carotenoid 1,2-hydratase [Anaerolineae bacterium]|jgi:predicted secreted hydrolase|nr:carotenoid 1,2-hydratase [Anaerolineae bacterium]